MTRNLPFNIKFKLNYKVLAFIFMMLFVFEPAWFGQFAIIDYLFTVGKVLVFFIVCGYFVIKNRLSAYIISVIIYCVTILIFTLMNDGNIRGAITFTVLTLETVGLIYMIFREEEKHYINILLLVFELLIYGNFISVILAPKGLYRMVQVSGWWSDSCWLLGLRNGMTTFYVITAFLELVNVSLNKAVKGPRIRCFIFYLISTLTVVQISISSTLTSAAKSAGGILLIWGLALAYFFIRRWAKILNILNFATAVFANFIFAFLLVVCRIQKAFAFIIVTILKKDINMTSRTAIWDVAIKEVKSRLFSGHGIEFGTVISARLNNVAAVSTTQNGWLDVLYIGGLVLFTSFIFVCYITGKSISQKRLDKDNVFLIGYMTAIYLLSGQAESLVGVRFFAFFEILICSSALLENSASTDRKKS